MSFQQGLSGLNASAKNLEVIGSNIATASVYGSKAARAEFADAYASAVGSAGGINNASIGVELSKVSQQFDQGSITTTDNPLDLAINGAGFFQVADATGQTLYTRNGQFKADRDGFIVNNQGQKLLGYAADTAGVIIPGQAGPIQLPNKAVAPLASTKVTIDMNLDARKGVTKPAADVPVGSGNFVDFNDPTTYNNATSINVFDGKGQEIPLTYYFQKTADNTWDVYASVPDAAAGGVKQVTVTGQAGGPIATLTFDGAGALTSTVPAAPATLDVPSTNLSGGATSTAISGLQRDLSATQYAASFGITKMSQDGYASGQLSGILVEPDGAILAKYSNGQSKLAAQLELASFRNPQGLQPVGGNAWTRTVDSGDPVVGAAGDGNLGALQSKALEESNVDLTAQLVDMISAQRAYQANAQTIKTQDAVMQTVMNLR